MRSKKLFMFLISLLMMMGSMTTYATDQDDELEVTIRVVDEDDDAEEVYKKIELPAANLGAGGSKSTKGLETADKAKNGGKSFGQQRAEEAKSAGEKSKDEALRHAKEASSQAQEKIKNSVGRGLSGQAKDKIPKDVSDAINRGKKP